ncbi:MAG: sulfatase-like hydrolase/transferase [Rikenellaceae bacterium]
MENLNKIGRIATPLCGLALLQPLTSCAPSEAANNEKPNFVVILCDDLGYGDLGCFNHPQIKTPNLDEMAQTGIRLTNFYSAAAVSSPSRAGLLTGRNPNRAGFYDYIPGPTPTPDCKDLVHLTSDEITIPMLLKGAGYSTCLSGKWHCSSKFNSAEQPNPRDMGFDHWFATHNNSEPTHKDPYNFVRNGEEVGQLEGFSCGLVVDEAIDWLEKRSGDDNPFYLQVCFHEPHEPIASPEDLVEKYMPVAICREQAEYFANVENMDIQTGRLMKYLRENYGENTLVVFSSDNGPETLNRYKKANHSYGTVGELSGMKLWTRDGGIRVCGIMNWLGKKTFTGCSDAVVSSLDYLPTFCELAGVELPSHDLDGTSCLDLFDDGEFERNKPLLWVYFNANNERKVALRDGEWKIMCRMMDGDKYLPRVANLYDGNIEKIRKVTLDDFKLYHIVNDLDESDDMKEENPEMFAKMKSMLESEYKKLLDDSKVWSRK